MFKFQLIVFFFLPNSTSGTSNNIQIQKQPINNVVTTSPYQATQFVNAQQQQQANCSYSTAPNQYASTMSSNSSSMIVNQIKLTNSDLVQQHHPVNNHSQPINQQPINQQPINQFLQRPISNQQLNSQLNQQAAGLENYSSQHVTAEQSSSTITLNNNLNSNLAKSSSTNQPLNTIVNSSNLLNQNSSSNYFQKLSSLTKESVQTSNSNLIVQNATIVNSTIVNTSTITLNESSSNPLTATNNPFNRNPILPPKSDSFLNLPSPVEQNKTKHLINPFTGQLEPMNSEDEEEMESTNCLSATSVNLISTTTTTTNSNSNSNVNTINTATNTMSGLEGQKNDLLKDINHLSDTDSGISKSTNDASSQSSTEISPIELLNHQDHHTKLAEPNLLANQSLVNFNNESIIGGSTILKNKLVNDMLNTNQDSYMHNNKDHQSINQQVYILNNSLDKSKSAIDNDQIDDYFNTDLGDFHTLNSDALVSDSNGKLFYF